MDRDFIPKRISEYREASYWEGRYERSTGGAPGEDGRHGATYDWLMKYDQLRDILKPHMLPTDRILILGCGNSSKCSPSTRILRHASWAIPLTGPTHFSAE